MRLATRTADLLSIVEGLLALFFLCAGGMILVMPVEVLTQQTVLPDALVRCIGAAEVLGAIGLILPELLHVRPVLTPVSAAGLGLIMTSTAVIIVAGGDLALAVIPVAVALLSAFVAYAHWRLASNRAAVWPEGFQPAN
jgi:hypothetical protein